MKIVPYATMFAVLTLVVVGLISGSHAAGAGRAFPIHSENYIIQMFQRINPSIAWDPTNFLVDKSGEFANCAQIRRGYELTNEVTPDRQTVGVLYDHLYGDGVDVDSINSYITTIVNNWVDSNLYDQQIRNADKFGCSVRPGCKGVVTVACLVSNGGYDYVANPQGMPPVSGQAFTPEQYSLAEYITGKRWDRSHFLENLSGVEITCSMLHESQWPFHEAISVARRRGMDIVPLKGEEPNKENTQQAIEVILKNFKSMRSASSMGCSLIPDCTSGRGDLGDEKWVVVVCLYS